MTMRERHCQMCGRRVGGQTILVGDKPTSTGTAMRICEDCLERLTRALRRETVTASPIIRCPDCGSKVKGEESKYDE